MVIVAQQSNESNTGESQEDNAGTQRSESNDEDEPSISKEHHAHLAQTADSLVTAILEGLKEIGSNLPGIGTVSVVLSTLR